MSRQVRPAGPIPARIMLVGEAPGAEEERIGEPFVGASGQELTKMLHEVGISRSLCFVTNVVRERPYRNDITYFIPATKKDVTSEHVRWRDRHVRPCVVEGAQLLAKEISMVKPNIIVAFGNTALWALTGLWGIIKQRGSMLYSNLEGAPRTQVIPTYHPAAILRQWEWRAIALHDLRRAAEYQDKPFPQTQWQFQVRASFPDIMTTLSRLQKRAEGFPHGPLELSFDLETRSGHIACVGIAWTLNDALSIPLMCVESDHGYWNEEEETQIVWALYRLLTHPNVEVIGQNLLYDSQYTYRHWHFIPHVTQDTMICHHVAFAGLPKNLGFQASLYCNQYRYWKDDSKHWHPSMGEEQLWRYNAEDCVRTLECLYQERIALKQMGLEEVNQFQQSMFWPILRAMNLGVRIDKEIRSQITLEVFEEMTKREEWFTAVLGHPLNPRSPKQMTTLFYEDLNLPTIRSRTTGNPTLDDDALARLATKEPLILPLVKVINEYRSLGVFLSTFLKAPLDIDGRMRCSYNPCGTETYRLSSSKNAFDSGTNLQNLPKGTEAKEPDELSLPNIRKMFIPDPGYTFFDLDLDRADLQVVVWEAEDAELKQMLREGVDVHTENAKLLGCSRQMGKTWVHGTNYGGTPRTMAVNCGLTVAQAEKMQHRWFQAHPGIKRWHERTAVDLRTKHMVTNKFGYRRFYFERIDSVLPEALAWVPQSTVAIYINKLWLLIYQTMPEVQVLLQVHDSLAGQFPQGFNPEVIRSAAKGIVVPYDDPLIIPIGIKTSNKSWGDCQ